MFFKPSPAPAPAPAFAGARLTPAPAPAPAFSRTGRSLLESLDLQLQNDMPHLSMCRILIAKQLKTKITSLVITGTA